MNSMVICLIIFAVMIILFFNRKIPMAFTSMGVIVALYVAREYWRLTFWLSSCSVSLSPACQLCLLWFILWLSACANS